MSGTNHRPARDEFWGKLTLEQIEHSIAVGTPRDKVLFALLRCSECHPHHYDFAVRPRLRRGGFAEWLRLLHERITKSRLVVAAEVYEEISDTDDAGEMRPLTNRDLEAITGLWASQVSSGLELLRTHGLLEPGFPFKLILKPTVVPPFPPGDDTKNSETVHCAVNENLTLLLKTKDLAKKLSSYLGVQIHCAVNGDIAHLEEAAQLMEDVCAERRRAENELRERLRRKLQDACAVNASLLIRSKTLDLRFPSPPTPSPADAEEGRGVQPNPPENETPKTTEYWPGFLFAAQTVGMAFTEAQIPRLERTFAGLSLDQRKAAIEGIELRRDTGQYNPEVPRLTPTLKTYLFDQKWTEPLRPSATKRPVDRAKLDDMIWAAVKATGDGAKR